MRTYVSTLPLVCLSLLLAASPASADPASTYDVAVSLRPAIVKPLTAAPPPASFGFAGAPRRAVRAPSAVVCPTPAPRLEGATFESGRGGKPACDGVTTTPSPCLTPKARSVRTTRVIRISVERPRVVRTCTPCVTTCAPRCDPCAPCVDVCRDPCDPCASACDVRDPMDTPTVFWSSGYHDGRRSCDPCASGSCAVGCAPRVRVVSCAPACSPCATPCFVPRRVCAPVCRPICGPVCGPVLRVGFGFPCGGFGWGGWGWGGCGSWGGCW